MTCFLCGSADGLMPGECGPVCADEDACAARLTGWRPTGLLAILDQISPAVTTVGGDHPPGHQ